MLANRSVTGNDAVAEGRVSASGSDGNHEGDVLESDDKGDHANSYDLEVKVADFGSARAVKREGQRQLTDIATSHHQRDNMEISLVKADCLFYPPSKPHHVLHANVIMSRDRMTRLRKDLVRPGFRLVGPSTDKESSSH